MKLLSFATPEGPAVAVRHAQRPLALPLHAIDPALAGDMAALLASGADALLRLHDIYALPDQAWRPLAELRLLPVVPCPTKIVCVGLNYAEHAREGGNARPDHPAFFLRGPSSLTAADGPLWLPRGSDKLDYEAELAVVIGRRTRHASPANALAAVAGYTCFNDGTLRDVQRRGTQWTLGKNADGTGALGPWLVTADELPPGASGLRICAYLNGRTMQDANTRDMLWPVAELIVQLSAWMTLEPGDVIATGTPAGVGYARTPPVFMAAGDEVEIEIDGIGRLCNRIVRETE